MTKLDKDFLLKKKAKEHDVFSAYVLKRGTMATLQEPVMTGYNNPIDVYDDTYTIGETSKGSETYDELGTAEQVAILIKSETLDEIETTTNEVSAGLLNTVSDWNVIEVFIVAIDKTRETPFKKGSLIKIDDFGIEMYVSKSTKQRHTTGVYKYKVSKNV